MYDIHTHTIYAKEKFNKEYWHEYAHAELIYNEVYKKLSMPAQYYLEYVSVFASALFIVVLFIDIVQVRTLLFLIIGIFALPYLILTFLEETYCDWRGYILKKRYAQNKEKRKWE